MKRRSLFRWIPFRFAALVIPLCAAWPQFAQAQTNWLGAPAGGTFSWTTAANWGAGSTSGVDVVLRLDNQDLITAGTTINLDGSRTLGALWIGDTNAATAFGFTINSYGSSGRLIFDVSNGTAAINVVATSAANNFNAPIVLNDDTVMTIFSSAANQQPGIQTINGNISGAGKFKITAGGGFHTSAAPSNVQSTIHHGISTNLGGLEIENVRYNPTSFAALGVSASVLDGGQIFIGGQIGPIRTPITLAGLGFNEAGQGGLGALRVDAGVGFYAPITATTPVVRLAGNGTAGGIYYGTLGESGGARSYDFGRWANAGAGMGGAQIVASSLGYTGSTYISSGTLTIGNGGTLGDLGTTSGIIFGYDNFGNNPTFTQAASSATLAFNRSDAFTITKPISQTTSTDAVPVLMTGNLTMAGLGAMTLDNGASGYTGTTTVNGSSGSLTIGSGGAYNFQGLGNVATANGAQLIFNTSSTAQIGGGGTVGNTLLPPTQAASSGGSGGHYLVQNGSGNLILSGTADNSANHLLVNAGTVTLNKHTTATSRAVGSGNELGMVINGGSVVYGADAHGDQIYGATDVRITGGVLDFAGKSEGFDVLTGNGGSVTNSGGTLSTLELGGDAVISTFNSDIGVGYMSIGNRAVWNGAGVYRADYGGVISGNLALTKRGSGLQAISGANTYTGATVVNGGVLAVKGSTLSSGTVTVSGGILAGTGSVGNVTVAAVAGSGINPGANALAHETGTLTAESLVVSGGALSFNLGANPAGPGNDQILVNTTGSIASGVTAAVSFVAPPTAGTYTLINATSGLTGTLPTFTNPANTRYTFTPALTANTLDLAVTGANAANIYTGGNFNWDYAALAGWSAGDFRNYDTATFGNNGNITATVNAAVESAITLANTGAGVNDVTINAGSGVLSGLTSIAKSGNGIATINGANTFFGDVNVTGGILRVGTGSAAAAGPLGNQAGQTYVSAGGTLDLNGASVFNEWLNIAGTGVGNGWAAGALINNAGGNNNAVRYLRLTADATFGSHNTNGGGRFDVRDATAGASRDGLLDGIGETFDLGGFTLTKEGLNQFSLVGVNMTVGTVNVNRGVFGLETSTPIRPGTTLNIGKYGFLGLWSPSQNMGINLGQTGHQQGVVNLNGGTITEGSGTSGGVFSSAINLGATHGGAFLNISNGASVNAFNGGISGGANLTKLGGGRAILNTANAATGHLQVAAGTVDFGDSLISGPSGNAGSWGGETRIVGGTVRTARGTSFTLPSNVKLWRGTLELLSPLQTAVTTVNSAYGTDYVNNNFFLGSGDAVLAAGTDIQAGAINIGRSSTATSNIANVTINPGASIVTSYVGLNEVAGNNVGILTMNGGSIRVMGSDVGEGSFRIGHWPGNSPALNMNGGTLLAPYAALGVSADGQGVALNLNGGLTQAFRVALDTRAAANAPYAAATTLDGGTLLIGQGGFWRGGASVGTLQTFNYLSGTFGAWGSTPAAAPTNFAFNPIGVEGQRTFDTNGFFLALGAIQGPGGIEKDDNGVLFLSSAGTQTGATNINAGVVRIGNANATGIGGVVNVSAGATFDVNGQTSTVTAPAIRPTVNAAGMGVLGQAAVWNGGPAQTNVPTFQQVNLTADASIGGLNRYDMVTAGIAAGGFKLSKVGPSEMWWDPTTNTGLAAIDVVSGRLGVQSSGKLGAPASPITVLPGGELTTFSTPTNNKAIVMAGGFLSNVTDAATAAWTGGFSQTAHSFIRTGGQANYNLAATRNITLDNAAFNLGGFTLTKLDRTTTTVRNATGMGAGLVNVVGGNLVLQANTVADATLRAASNDATITLDDTGGAVSVTGTVILGGGTLNNLVGNHPVTVDFANYGKISAATGTTLTLTEANPSPTGGATFLTGGTVAWGGPVTYGMTAGTTEALQSFASISGGNVTALAPTLTTSATGPVNLSTATPTDLVLATHTAAGVTAHNTISSNLTLGALIAERDVQVTGNALLKVNTGGVIIRGNNLDIGAANSVSGRLTSGDLLCGHLYLNMATSFETLGATALRLAVVDNPIAANSFQPVTLIKNGSGGLMGMGDNGTAGTVVQSLNTGGAVVNGGRWVIRGAGALGYGNVTVNEGGQLAFYDVQAANGNGVFNNMTLSGLGAGEGGGLFGALRLQSNLTSALSGSITLAGTARVANPNTDHGSINGLLRGAGTFQKTGANVVNLSHPASSYTGATQVGWVDMAGGVLAVTKLANGGQPSSIGASSSAASNLVLNNGTLRYLGMAGSTDRLFTVGLNSAAVENFGHGGLNFTNTGALDVVSGTTRNLVFAGDVSGLYLNAVNGLAPVNVFSPSIVDPTHGFTNITKNGSSTWVLAGNNTGNGAVSITNGILQVGNGGTTGNLPGGATPDASIGLGNVTLSNQAKLVFNRSDAITVKNQITGGGAVNQIVQAGSGTTTLAGIYDNTNVAIRVDAGTLVLAKEASAGAQWNSGRAVAVDSGTLGSLHGVIINGGTLRLNGAANAPDQIGDRTDVYMRGGVFDINGKNEVIARFEGVGGVVTGGGVLGIGSAPTAVNNSQSWNGFAGTIAGGTRLQKMGGNGQMLRGDSTLDGGAQIDNGRLIFGYSGAPDTRGGNTGSLAGPITINAAGLLTSNRNGNFTLANAIHESSTGTLEQTGKGVTTVTGLSPLSYLGLGVRRGTLQLTPTGGLQQILGGTTLDGGALRFTGTELRLDNSVSFAGGDLVADGGEIVMLYPGRAANGSVNFSAVNGGAIRTNAVNDADVFSTAAHAYATFNGNDWAAQLGDSRLGAFSNYNSVYAAGNHTLVTGDSTFLTPITTSTVKFGGSGINLSLDGQTLTLNKGGILNPANAGASVNTISGGSIIPSTATAVDGRGADIIVHAHNLAAETVISAALANQVNPANQNATTTAGSANVTVTSTAGLYVGMPVSGNVNIPAGRWITGITNATVFTINSGTGVTAASAIATSFTSANGLVKAGAGVLRLTGNNTILGNINVNQGKLVIGDGMTSGAIPAAASQGIINDAVLAWDRNDTVTVASTISGFGEVRQEGTGTLNLTGANTFSGGLTVVRGTVAGNAAGSFGGQALGLLAGPVVLGDAASTAADNPRLLPTGAITIPNNIFAPASAAATVTIGATAAAATQYSGLLQLDRSVILGGSTDRTSFTGPIYGNIGTLTIANTSGGATGRVDLQAENFFTATDVNVNDTAILQVGSGNFSDPRNHLPDSIRVNILGVAETIFQLNGDSETIGELNSANPLALVRAVAGGPTVLTIANGGVYNGKIDGNANGGLIIESTGGNLTLGGTNDNPNGRLLVNGGSVTLAKVSGSGARAVGGGAVVNSGNLILGGSGGDQIYDGGAAGSGPAVVVNGGSFDLNGQNESIGALQGLGGVVTNGNATASTLTLGANSTTGSAFWGSIQNGVGTVAITKIGTGAAVLAGNNTHSGVTTISAGTLQVGAGTNTGSLGSGNVVNNGILVFNRSDAHTVANNISGSGPVIHNGATKLSLTGTNTYAGPTVVNSGSLSVGDGGTTGSLGGGNVTVADSTTLEFNRSNAFTVANAVGGKGGVTQAGTGVTTISAGNTWMGTTTIAAGTLLLGANDTLPNTAPMTLSGGTLNTGGFDDTTGVLTVTANSVLDFGAGVDSQLVFADAGLWTGILNIWNYDGSKYNPGMDKLLFTNTTSMTANNLTDVRFFSDAGMTLIGTEGAFIGNELVPVPEASTVGTALLLLLGIGWRERRQAVRARK
jgi:fibronectin-binding autotransporter adhesin